MLYCTNNNLANTAEEQLIFPITNLQYTASHLAGLLTRQSVRRQTALNLSTTAVVNINIII